MLLTHLLLPWQRLDIGREYSPIGHPSMDSFLQQGLILLALPFSQWLVP